MGRKDGRIEEESGRDLEGNRKGKYSLSQQIYPRKGDNETLRKTAD